MPKFNLGKAPVNFKRAVLIDMFDGSQDSIEMTFKYRSRTEYAKLMDDVIFAAKNKNIVSDDKTAADKQDTFLSLLSEQDELSVDYVLQIAEGWDLSNEFNKATLKEIKNKFPGAIEAIIEAYRVSILEGRLKN